MRNPITDFISGVKAGLGGLASGTTPLGAPSIELMGTNIPLVPLISPRDYFLQILDTWSASIPTRTQWIIVFESFPPALNTKIIQQLENHSSSNQWDISVSKKLLITYPFQKVMGCVFAQGVSIPQEQGTSNSVSVPNNRGFIPGVISGPRQEYQQLRIDFRETNSSFNDLIIRPWVMLSSHFGRVARPGDINGNKDFKNIKTNIHVMQLAKTFAKASQIPRKFWTFYNCTPELAAATEMTYDSESLQILNTDWKFTHHALNPGTYLPIIDTIKRISSGDFTKGMSDIFLPSI